MTYVFIVFLAVASATTYHVFIFPNKFAPAGVGGITTMVQYAFGFSAGYLTLIVNVPLAVLVFFFGDRTFAVRSFLFVLVFSAMILVWDAVGFYSYDAGDNKLLAVIAAGHAGRRHIRLFAQAQFFYGRHRLRGGAHS